MDYGKYLEEFMDEVYDGFLSENNGGMKSPDMFTMYVMLKEIKPDVVIESGVWKGQGTKIIREAVGEDCKIICLEPRVLFGYQDDGYTEYHMGEDFKDFSELDLSEYEGEKKVGVFDDHINAAKRLEECKLKKIDYAIFNDNYPVNCGSHVTLEHVINKDERFMKSVKNAEESIKEIKEMIEEYKIYPNIFPGKIKTGEGYFECESYFKETETYNEIGQTKDIVEKYKPLYEEKESYRWNTLVKLK